MTLSSSDKKSRIFYVFGDVGNYLILDYVLWLLKSNHFVDIK